MPRGRVDSDRFTQPCGISIDLDLDLRTNATPIAPRKLWIESVASNLRRRENRYISLD